MRNKSAQAIINLLKFDSKLFSWPKRKVFFIKKNFIWYFQTFIVYFSNILSNFFLRKEVKGLENLQGLNGGGIIFVANHHGRFDPYLIGPSLPRAYLNTVKAVRFMTHYRFIWFKWYGPILWLTGAYSIHPSRGKIKLNATLKKTIQFLKDNQSVLVFPTAKLKKEVNPEEARPGIAYLAKELNPVIVPVLVQGTHKINPLDFIFRKRKAKVIFGKPFRYKQVADSNLDNRLLAKIIMEQVKALKCAKL
jgi:1-acyl-sn-glycerol-3-phosphate acyltransferase